MSVTDVLYDLPAWLMIAALAGGLLSAVVYWIWMFVAWLTGREFNP